jgi:hypothetical protein
MSTEKIYLAALKTIRALIEDRECTSNETPDVTDRFAYIHDVADAAINAIDKGGTPMSAHTPGPWSFEKSDDKETYVIWGPDNQWVGRIGGRGYPLAERVIADANLIAAATELLSELQQAQLDIRNLLVELESLKDLSEIDFDDEDAAIVLDIKRRSQIESLAIAKAEGRQ